MEKQRATVYLEEPVLRALKLKAAETGTNVSALVSLAVRQSLAEDRDDLRALADRVAEPVRPFGEFLEELADEGLL
jgi:hypothetical protein